VLEDGIKCKPIIQPTAWYSVNDVATVFTSRTAL